MAHQQSGVPMPPKKQFNVLPNPDIDLMDRQSDRMNITLWWVKGTMATYVTVDDRRTGVFFRVDTPEGERPIHVFEHPHSFKADEL